MPVLGEQATAAPKPQGMSVQLPSSSRGLGGTTDSPGLGGGLSSPGLGGQMSGVGAARRAPTGSALGKPGTLKVAKDELMLGSLNPLDVMYEILSKQAAVPMPGGDPAAMGGDPMAGGGMPPGGDPMAGGMPPPDPAMAMGGLGGAGPMDPAMMAGLPGGLPPEAGGPPPSGGAFTPEQKSELESMIGGIKDQIAQGQQAGAGGKKNVEAMIQELSGQVKGIMAAMTGFMAGKEGKPISAVPQLAELQQGGAGGGDPAAGGGLPGGNPMAGAKSAAVLTPDLIDLDYKGHIRADDPAGLSAALNRFFTANPVAHK